MGRRDDLSETLYPKAVKAIRQGNVDEAIQYVGELRSFSIMKRGAGLDSQQR